LTLKASLTILNRWTRWKPDRAPQDQRVVCAPGRQPFACSLQCSLFTIHFSSWFTRGPGYRCDTRRRSVPQWRQRN